MSTTRSSDFTRDASLEAFIDRCHEAIRQQSQGHPEPFLELWSHADDVSLMAAIGGYQVGFAQLSELLIAASKTQSFASWSAENLVTIAGDDLAVTIDLEHYGRGADSQEEDMTLRATQIYRREDGDWKVIHRHGDILQPIEAKW
jgi:ketosteroid isomerase-like protein